MYQTKVEAHFKGTSVKFLTFEEAMKIMAEEAKFPIAIIGASGTGKTWLADQVSKRIKGLKVVHLDSFCNKVGERWTLDIPSVPAGDLYEGWGYGIKELVMARCVSIFVPFPDVESFKKMQVVKAFKSKTKNLPTSWVENWRKLSRISPGRYADLMIDRISLAYRDAERSHQIYVVAMPTIPGDKLMSNQQSKN